MVPSEEVRIVPLSKSISSPPTAMNVLFPKVKPEISCVVPEVLEVQVIPSDEVRMVPF